MENATLMKLSYIIPKPPRMLYNEHVRLRMIPRRSGKIARHFQVPLSRLTAVRNGHFKYLYLRAITMSLFLQGLGNISN